MPRASELPDALKPLARRQAAEVRHVNFGQDADTLVARMRRSLGDKTLDKGGPETVGDKAAVVLELERLAAQEREAKAEAETEAKRKADEAEQQRLAAAKAEQERQVREVAEADASKYQGRTGTPKASGSRSPAASRAGGPATGSQAESRGRTTTKASGSQSPGSRSQTARGRRETP